MGIFDGISHEIGSITHTVSGVVNNPEVGRIAVDTGVDFGKDVQKTTVGVTKSVAGTVKSITDEPESIVDKVLGSTEGLFSTPIIILAGGVAVFLFFAGKNSPEIIRQGGILAQRVAPLAAA